MPQKIIPLKFVLKFVPPVIGLMYKRNLKEKKKHIYNIVLNELINLPSIEEIANKLIFEHWGFLNEDNVKFQQVKLYLFISFIFNLKYINWILIKFEIFSII